MTTYRVAQWRERFENNKSRERDRCSFVCIPNKQDGLGLAHILSEPDGAALFGIWTLVVQACSRHGRPRNGWLTEDGTEAGAPWTVDDMAMRWRRPSSEIQRMIEVLSRAKVGWLISAGQTSTVAVVPTEGQQQSPETPGREEKRREGERREAPSLPVPSGIETEAEKRKREDAEQIAGTLAGLFLDHRPEPLMEWVALAREAGCKSLPEAQAFIVWTVKRLRTEMNVRYARDCIALVRAWNEWARERFYKPDQTQGVTA